MNGHVKETSGSEEREDRKFKWMDAIAKLLAAIAVVCGVIIAKTYETKMTATTLLNQREQAESNLRASMFHDLIDPILGSPGENKCIDPDRERLLVELLALNFHEHFEFKPLLVEVDNRLRNEKGDSKEKCQKGRCSLRSTARRVLDRQMNMLRSEAQKSKERFQLERIYFQFQEESQSEIQGRVDCNCWANFDYESKDLKEDPNLNSPNTPAFVKYLKKKDPEEDPNLSIPDTPVLLIDTFSEKVCIKSPDEKYYLEMAINKADFKNQEVEIQVTVRRLNKSKKPSFEIIDSFPFTLTFFDFPLTDNTEISSHLRFSAILDSMEKIDGKKTITILLIWFPKNFIPPRERPINYNEMRELLGLKK